jgi:hypothetical protein
VIATIVEWDALLQVIWVSLLTGVGVTAAYGFALLGLNRALEYGRAGRAIEYGRAGRAIEAVAYGVVGGAGLAVVVAAIAFGIAIMAGG